VPFTLYDPWLNSLLITRHIQYSELFAQAKKTNFFENPQKAQEILLRIKEFSGIELPDFDVKDVQRLLIHNENYTRRANLTGFENASQDQKRQYVYNSFFGMNAPHEKVVYLRTYPLRDILFTDKLIDDKDYMDIVCESLKEGFLNISRDAISNRDYITAEKYIYYLTLFNNERNFDIFYKKFHYLDKLKGIYQKHVNLPFKYKDKIDFNSLEKEKNQRFELIRQKVNKICGFPINLSNNELIKFWLKSKKTFEVKVETLSDGCNHPLEEYYNLSKQFIKKLKEPSEELKYLTVSFYQVQVVCRSICDFALDEIKKGNLINAEKYFNYALKFNSEGGFTPRTRAKFIELTSQFREIYKNNKQINFKYKDRLDIENALQTEKRAVLNAALSKDELFEKVINNPLFVKFIDKKFNYGLSVLFGKAHYGISALQDVLGGAKEEELIRIYTAASEILSKQYPNDKALSQLQSKQQKIIKLIKSKADFSKKVDYSKPFLFPPEHLANYCLDESPENLLKIKDSIKKNFLEKFRDEKCVEENTKGILHFLHDENNFFQEGYYNDNEGVKDVFNLFGDIFAYLEKVNQSSTDEGLKKRLVNIQLSILTSMKNKTNPTNPRILAYKDMIDIKLNELLQTDKDLVLASDLKIFDKFYQNLMKCEPADITSYYRNAEVFIPKLFEETALEMLRSKHFVFLKHMVNEQRKFVPQFKDIMVQVNKLLILRDTLAEQMQLGEDVIRRKFRVKTEYDAERNQVKSAISSERVKEAIETFKELGAELPENPSYDDIKRAYQTLVMKHHPDREQYSEFTDEEKTKDIFAAFKVLRDHFEIGSIQSTY